MTFFGILLILLGLVSIAAPLVTGISLTLMLGLVLLAAGITQVVWGFKTKSFKSAITPLLWGALTLLAGLYTLARPDVALAGLTLFLAGYFFVSGLYEVWLALRLRPRKGWGSTLFAGIVTLILGVMIWRRFPTSAGWLVGTLVGIKLIFAGWAMLSIRAVAEAVDRL
jgi:uncharacterized membrane protein HdeD (DUF308 family)